MVQKRPTKKPPTKKRRKTAGRVTKAEAEKMYSYWHKNRETSGYSGTARRFKRGLSTVRRLAGKYDWLKRSDAIRGELQEHVDQGLLQGDVDNATMLREVKKKLFKALNDSDPVKPAVSDLLNLIKYEEEHYPQGDSPTPGNGSAEKDKSSGGNGVFILTSNVVTNIENLETGQKKQLESNLVSRNEYDAFKARHGDRFKDTN